MTEKFYFTDDARHGPGKDSPKEVKIIYIKYCGLEKYEHDIRVRLKLGDKFYTGVLEMNE
tara:strand:- start:141 stop:320 length:180 start_codon:yes stop_codon:yes gene_type:complete